MLGISDSTAERFQKIQERAHKVVFGKNKGITLRKQLPAKETDFVCQKFLNVSMEYHQSTSMSIFLKIPMKRILGGIISLLKIPKVRTEAGQKTFAFQGARRFNQLDASARNETSVSKIRTELVLQRTYI